MSRVSRELMRSLDDLVLASRQQFGGLVGVVDGLVGEDFLVNGFAVHELQSHFHDLRAKQRVAFNVRLDPAIDHGLETTAGAVDGNDLEIAGFHASSLDGFDGADGHVIIVDEHALDLAGVFLQEGFHHGLAFGTGEVAGLGVQNLDVGIESFAETLGAANCSAGAGGAGQFKNVAAVGEQFVHILRQPACLRFPCRNRCEQHTGICRP